MITGEQLQDMASIYAMELVYQIEFDEEDSELRRLLCDIYELGFMQGAVIIRDYLEKEWIKKEVK